MTAIELLAQICDQTPELAQDQVYLLFFILLKLEFLRNTV